jgi:hypothetical protein
VTRTPQQVAGRLTAHRHSEWAVFADLLDPPENPYVSDPVGWVRDRLGEFMWSKQREIAESVIENRYTAVQSAHDTGKSHGASRILCHSLDTREDPFGTTTAPTTKQVHAILWRYIGQAHRKGNLRGRITLDDEWYMGPGGKELVAFGRKPADHDQSAFQGIHALNPLILIDEACGIPKSIFDAVDSLATNANARVLAIGNPDDPSSHFAQICKPGSGWHVIKVSAFDTPAYTGEEVPEELLPLLVSPEVGRGAQTCLRRQQPYLPIEGPWRISRSLGRHFDLARVDRGCAEANARTDTAADHRCRHRPLGEDETMSTSPCRTAVIMRREGSWFAHFDQRLQGYVCTAATTRLANQLHPSRRAIVDVPGVGGGVVDRLVELDLPVVPYNGGEAPIDKERFVNAR